MLRHALNSSSVVRADILLSQARDFSNQHSTDRSSRRSPFNLLRWLAWLAGVALALMYLSWFFKHLFNHLIR